MIKSLMRFIALLVLLVVFLAAAVFGVMFATQNTGHNVSLQMPVTGWQSPELEVVYWIGMGFLAGILVGGGLMLGSNIGYRLRARKARKEADKLQAELDRLQQERATEQLPDDDSAADGDSVERAGSPGAPALAAT